MKDTYQTIEKISEGLFKDKGSKFISYAYPITNEDQVKEILTEIKKSHHSARHHCYAWRMGTENITFRANDDGEPSSTAGKPILGQLLSYDLTNILIVVVRYFGGTLLGVSGLINAYKSAAADAINNNNIIEKKIEAVFEIQFSYNELNSVMQILKNENINQLTTDFKESCMIRFSVRKSDAIRVNRLFEDFYGVKITLIN
ncbi:MAG: YigZ family protein [Prolixibacteraceae bacterium]|nr:YigZ family protein [Prolixibacteraceae bacterium]MBN2773206.1 YigZ family protein [Prolixibacteraceae bacterium]